MSEVALIVLMPSTALDAAAMSKETPESWTYVPQFLSWCPSLDEVMVHVTSDSPQGLDDFMNDAPGASVVTSHAIPSEWGSDWVQLSYPSEKIANQSVTVNPYELFERGRSR